VVSLLPIRVLGDLVDNKEVVDSSKFKYLVSDAAVELNDMFYICTYCGSKSPVKNKIVHSPTCPATIVFNSLSKNTIDMGQVQ